MVVCVGFNEALLLFIAVEVGKDRYKDLLYYLSKNNNLRPSGYSAYFGPAVTTWIEILELVNKVLQPMYFQ